jgi:glycerophosphoryl diester phosphodiesterase
LTRNSPLLIAHRGESHLAPENTLAAFQLAWSLGDDAIEMDVHLTRDGQVVVCHDDDTLRTTGGRAKRVIRDSTAGELRALDVGAWKGPNYAGERIPLLAEVLAGMPAGKRAFVELKAEGLDLVGAAIGAMKASGHPADAMTAISFHAASIAEFKRRWPDGPKAYYLCEFRPDEATAPWSPTVDELIAAARACGADGLDVENAPPVDQAFVEQVHAAGMPCFVWTEDDPAAARRYADWGVDGITTNRAHWMRGQLTG